MADRSGRFYTERIAPPKQETIQKWLKKITADGCHKFNFFLSINTTYLGAIVRKRRYKSISSKITSRILYDDLETFKIPWKVQQNKNIRVTPWFLQDMSGPIAFFRNMNAGWTDLVEVEESILKYTRTVADMRMVLLEVAASETAAAKGEEDKGGTTEGDCKDWEYLITGLMKATRGDVLSLPNIWVDWGVLFLLHTWLEDCSRKIDDHKLNILIREQEDSDEYDSDSDSGDDDSEYHYDDDDYKNYFEMSQPHDTDENRAEHAVRMMMRKYLFDFDRKILVRPPGFPFTFRPTTE